MRRAFIVILALTLIAGLSLAAVAQEGKKAAKPEKAEKAEKGDKAALKPKGLDSDLEALGLTDEQKAKLAPVIEQRAARQKQLMDSGVQGDDLRKKKQEIRDWYEAEIGKILTDEQKKRRAELKRGPKGGEEKKPK